MRMKEGAADVCRVCRSFCRHPPSNLSSSEVLTRCREFSVSQVASSMSSNVAVHPHPSLDSLHIALLWRGSSWNTEVGPAGHPARAPWILFRWRMSSSRWATLMSSLKDKKMAGGRQHSFFTYFIPLAWVPEQEAKVFAGTYLSECGVCTSVIMDCLISFKLFFTVRPFGTWTW